MAQKVFWKGIQNTLLQKPYELPIGIQTYKVEFATANWQFDWLEISLVYDKRDKYWTIYGSYNTEIESTFIQNVSIENVSNNYIIANKLKFNVSGATEKHMLYKQFVAWNCNSCSIAQFTDYTNNPVYQVLP